MQRFADVDVAHTNHDFLVEQGQFYGGFSPLKTSGKRLGVPRVKRFRAERGEQFVRRLLFGRKQIDDAKTARVSVHRSRAVGEHEFQMVVLASVAGLVTKRRDGDASVDRSQEGFGGRRLGTIKNGVSAAHAEMRKQNAPVA